MGKRTRKKLIIRSLILLVSIFMFIVDSSLIETFMNVKILANIKIYHLFWLYLMYEMIVVIFPAYNNYSYSGKLFERHYKEDVNYKKEKLENYTKKNYLRALRTIVFWGSLNLVIAYIYYKLNLNKVYMYLLFLFYYWSDMFCVNVWCPFHKIIVQNKCCNECRIYNWGHIMYLTPLIFVPNLWTYSLVLVAVIILIQWEYMNIKYPERFSPISNKNLRCSNCENSCRYNKLKSEKVQYSKAS
ncbi:hypothetical protein [Terrisporobacter sp.]